MSHESEILTSSKSNEWMTPKLYIEMTRRVMGSIDLDPASTALANQMIGAKKFFTKEDDGLRQPWDGRVWLNPPYGRGGQEAWSRKLITEYAIGSVSSAVLLVNAVTDTKWFQHLWPYLICFVRGRIQFINPDGSQSRNSPTHGSVFVYFGKNTEVFSQVFSSIGHVVS